MGLVFQDKMLSYQYGKPNCGNRVILPHSSGHPIIPKSPQHVPELWCLFQRILPESWKFWKKYFKSYFCYYNVPRILKKLLKFSWNWIGEVESLHFISMLGSLIQVKWYVVIEKWPKFYILNQSLSFGLPCYVQTTNSPWFMFNVSWIVQSMDLANETCYIYMCYILSWATALLIMGHVAWRSLLEWLY